MRWSELERILVDIRQEVADGSGGPLPGRDREWRAVMSQWQEVARHGSDLREQRRINFLLAIYYRRIGDNRNLAVALHRLGMVARERGLWGVARRWYMRSLVIRRMCQDVRGQAQLLHNLALVSYDAGQLSRSLRLYRQSLRLKERIGDEEGMGTTHHAIGLVYKQNGDSTTARDHLIKSLNVRQRLNNWDGLAKTLHELGVLELEARRLERAEEYLRESLRVSLRSGRRYGQAATLHNLALVAEERGDMLEATSWYKEALEIAIEINDFRGIGETQLQLANLHRGIDPALALPLYLESYENLKKANYLPGQCVLLVNLGQLMMQVPTQYETAETMFQEAIALCQSIHHRRVEASAWYNRAILAEWNSQYANATAYLGVAENLYSQIDYPLGLADVLHQRGSIAEEIGEFDKAFCLFQEAEASYSSLGAMEQQQLAQRSIQRVNTAIQLRKEKDGSN